MPHLLPEKKCRVQSVKVVHVISTFNSVQFMEVDLCLLWNIVMYPFFYRYNMGPLVYIWNTSRERIILAKLNDGISQKWGKKDFGLNVHTLFIHYKSVCVYVYILSYWNIFIVQIKPASRQTSFICWQMNFSPLYLLNHSYKAANLLRDRTLFSLLLFCFVYAFRVTILPAVMVVPDFLHV